MPTPELQPGTVDSKKMAVVDTVGSILSKKGSQVWHIAPDATVHDAMAQMAEREIGALPVISGGELVGILSERDYARKVMLQGRSSQQTSVQEIMTEAPITVTADYTVHQCLRIMIRRRVRHLPVMDADTVSGIISMGDLVNAVIAAQAFTIDQLQTYIKTDYPG